MSMKMTMAEFVGLEPCPFCGGEAEICHVRDICRNPEDWYWGKCLSCHISGRHYPTEAEAITAWNARAERTCEIESSYLNDFTVKNMCWYEFEMKCGGRFTWDEMEPPNHCPNCGGEVREKAGNE